MKGLFYHLLSFNLGLELCSLWDMKIQADELSV